MPPSGSPKNATRNDQTFEVEDRILTRDQLQQLIHAGVKQQLESLRQTTGASSHSFPRITPGEFKRVGVWAPRVDVWDDPESPNIVATFEIPGVCREDLSVNIEENRYLVVQGQRRCRLIGDSDPESTSALSALSEPELADEDDQEQPPQRQARFEKAELRYGRFGRRLDLGRGVFEYRNADINADLRDGMLTVTWPRYPRPPAPCSANGTLRNYSGGRSAGSSPMITPIAALRTSTSGLDTAYDASLVTASRATASRAHSPPVLV